MINKTQLLGHILYVMAFLLSVMVGQLFAVWFLEHLLVKLPVILQKPIIPYVGLFMLSVFFIHRYENRYLWARFFPDLVSIYHLAPLNIGFIAGFIATWHKSPHVLFLWKFMYSLCCQ